MSLVPKFEIGLWNAWIFVFYFQLVFILAISTNKDVVKRGLPDELPYNKTEKKIYRFLTIIYYAVLIYTIFLPLTLETIWFYAGLPLCIFGLIIYTIAVVNFSTTELDKPVTKGLFRYSRHPLYLSQALIFAGIGIACTSWIFLLFFLVYSVLQFILISPEERFCLDKYGDAYREYIEKTPRHIGVIKKVTK